MMTAQRIAAIPTKYKGVQFRSRLEARWAAWMDMVGWDWDYEPFDAVGYIPDFVVRTEGEFIVEVKPFDHLEYDNYGDGLVEWDECIEKIRKAGITIPVLILGSRIHRYEKVYEPVVREVDEETKKSAIIGIIQEHPFQILNAYIWPDYKATKLQWNQAGNLVQYKGAANG